MTASLIALPVTWLRYSAALVPFAMAAVARRHHSPQPGRVSALAIGAMASAAYAVFAPVTVWIAVALVLVAVRASRPALTTRHAALVA
ncbi:MAG: hypothetical protein ACHQ01_03595 [Candidatus Limnocylindrales bacterium]